VKLLLGTTNPGKIADYKKFLVHSNLEIVTLKDLGMLIDEPLEIGDTFEENALQKARFYAEKTEYPTLGDDGGLEIEALGGRPGVESRRWVGPHGTDEDRINKVIELMYREKNRQARFRIVICVYFPVEKESVIVERSTPVMIAEKPSSKMVPSLPYRSVMFLPKYDKYYAELSEKELAEIDHRSNGSRELLLKIEPYLNA